GAEIAEAAGVLPGRRAVLHLLLVRAEAVPLGAVQHLFLHAQDPQGGEVALERAAERGLVLPGEVAPADLLQLAPEFADLDPPSRVRVRGRGRRAGRALVPDPLPQLVHDRRVLDDPLLVVAAVALPDLPHLA